MISVVDFILSKALSQNDNKWREKIESWFYLVSKGDVMEGTIRISKTRIPLMLIISHFEKGYSSSDIKKLFPDLKTKQIKFIKRLWKEIKKYYQSINNLLKQK